MTASQLSLYNGALGILGVPKLASLTENREERHILDETFSRSLIRRCLEQGQWNFALRTTGLDSDDDIDPQYGFTYAFTQPTDWVRTVGLSGSETLFPPLTDVQCKHEQGIFYAYLDTIYLRYVSDHADYGSDYTLWPESFAEFVEGYLAFKACPRIKEASSKIDEVKKEYKRLKSAALAKDGIGEGMKRPPPGRWSSSRHRRIGRDYPRGSLIG